MEEMASGLNRRQFSKSVGFIVLGTVPYSDTVATKPPDVVHEIENPGTGSGLAWDGEFIWTSNEENKKIYAVSPSSGSTNSELSVSFRPDGLTWDGRNLWSADDEKLYQIDPENGDIVDKFASCPL